MYEKKIPIQITQTFDSPFVQFGLPLPCNKVYCLEQLSLEIDSKNIDISAVITALWHDDSIKYCVVTCHIDNYKSEIINAVINISPIKPSPRKKLALPITTNTIESIDAPYVRFEYLSTTNEFKIIDKSTHIEYTGKLELINIEGKKLVSEFKNYSYTQNVNVGNKSSIDSELIVEHQFHDSVNNQHLISKLTVQFINDGKLVNIKHTLLNPKAAEHAGGLWDLGDAHSFNFISLSCKLKTNKPLSTQLKLTSQEHKVNTATPTEITQYSSGGKNWQSPVHKDKDNAIPWLEHGFKIIQNGQVVEKGLRTCPILQIDQQDKLVIENFWQNFPSGLNVDTQSVSVNFFPKIENNQYELQGGEQKTHSFWLQLKPQASSYLDWVNQPATVKLPPEWIEQTSLNQLVSITPPCSKWQSLLQNALDGENNFFQKRENLDEYGWRNFGDLYADHETAEYAGKELFVSHYNNQYDPILGFLKQYILSGDSRWNELANDLAAHVVDIDIYHTHDDKDEYNGGLFWHTDHYLQAYTSTHRSYSKHQPSDAYQDHAGGGGPGGQHCYTTGLALHYMQTANIQSKEAVLTLTNWITHVYEGSGTCLELLLAYKNRHIAGYKNHFTGQYPLDRGTANYIVALLDSYEITGKSDYLERAEHIFRHSFHPNEDINLRQLNDVENTWFYTVLLQAVCKYLGIKESASQLDDNFYYCRDSLLNFARWMAIHEYPYLEKPEILEYPNDTWTAQDLRKVHVFAAAYYYSPNKNYVFLEKAQFFENDILNRLNSSATKTYTRILVLVLQNYGYLNLYTCKTAPYQYKHVSFDWPKAKYQQTSNLGGLVLKMLKRLSKLSIKAELDWLKKRLK